MSKRELVERIEQLAREVAELRQMLEVHQAWPHPYTIIPWPQTPPIITWGDSHTWSPESMTSSPVTLTDGAQWSNEADGFVA